MSTLLQELAALKEIERLAREIQKSATDDQTRENAGAILRASGSRQYLITKEIERHDADMAPHHEDADAPVYGVTCITAAGPRGRELSGTEGYATWL